MKTANEESPVITDDFTPDDLRETAWELATLAAQLIDNESKEALLQETMDVAINDAVYLLKAAYAKSRELAGQVPSDS